MSSPLHPSPSLLTRTAQILGITTSAFLTGFGISFSAVSLPVILASAPPDLLAKQWLLTYKIGKATMPPLAVVSAVCFGFLGTRVRERKGFFPDAAFDPTAPWALYTAAAVLVPAIVPYTLLIMMPTTVEPLIAAAKDPSALSTERTLDLMREWQAQNYVRQGFAALGSLLGAVATMIL